MSGVVGTWRYAAGTAATVTLPTGATVKTIACHSSGAASVAIFGGTAIPVISGAPPLVLKFDHDQCCAGQNQGGGLTIVFTGTDSYYVETIGPGSTAT